MIARGVPSPRTPARAYTRKRRRRQRASRLSRAGAGDHGGMPDAWLAARLDAAQAAWLAAAVERIATQGLRAAGIAIAQAARRLPGIPLDPALDPAGGWVPAHWSLRDAARVRLALALAAQAGDAWPAALDALCRDADLGELIALHRGLALYPQPERLRARAAAALRSSIGDLFAAVALDNPYAAAWLAEPAWNQLVLKAFFTGSDTTRILAWRPRANPALAAMLRDYARERRAAGRAIDAHLWTMAAVAAEPAVAAELRALAETAP